MTKVPSILLGAAPTNIDPNIDEKGDLLHLQVLLPKQIRKLFLPYLHLQSKDIMGEEKTVLMKINLPQTMILKSKMRNPNFEPKLWEYSLALFQDYFFR